MNGTLSLSPIVAGAWRMASWEWTALGVTSFDHADIYGGYSVEALFGEALVLAPGLRAQLQLVTKCGIQLVSEARPGTTIKHYDTTARHIIASAEQSLRNLRTDVIDVLLLHRPDPLMDADEVAQAFDTLSTSGKVRQFGVSNFSPAQFALLHSRTPLVTNQIEWHPLHQAPLHDGTLDQCQQLRVRPMIWSPLAGGALFTSEADAAVRVRQVLAMLGADLGASAETVAFAWLLRHPARVIPITGSRRLDALRHAVDATRLSLDAQQWTAIHVAATGKNVP